jgi:hypothetical protein
MDDPTTYLSRDSDNVVIILAASVALAQDVARQYGVSIQVNMPGGLGIRVVTNQAEAAAAVLAYPPTTPWCTTADKVRDKLTYDTLRAGFGVPVTIATALGVETDGIAWRPDRFPVF